MTLLDKVQQTLASTLKVPASRISPATAQDDLQQWDSVGHVNLMMAIEQTFDLTIEVEDFEGLTSVASIVDYLERQGAA